MDMASGELKRRVQGTASNQGRPLMIGQNKQFGANVEYPYQSHKFLAKAKFLKGGKHETPLYLIKRGNKLANLGFPFF